MYIYVYIYANASPTGSTKALAAFRPHLPIDLCCPAAPAACGAPPGRAPPPAPHCGRVRGNQSSSPECLGKLGPTRLDGYTNILYHIISYYSILCYIIL